MVFKMHVSQSVNPVLTSSSTGNGGIALHSVLPPATSGESVEHTEDTSADLLIDSQYSLSTSPASDDPVAELPYSPGRQAYRLVVEVDSFSIFYTCM